MSETQATDFDSALQISAAIVKRLSDALSDALLDDRDVAVIVSRAPAITSHAIARLWVTHAAAVLLDDPRQLPALLDRLDQLRRQLVALGTAGRATETLQ